MCEFRYRWNWFKFTGLGLKSYHENESFEYIIQITITAGLKFSLRDFVKIKIEGLECCFDVLDVDWISDPREKEKIGRSSE